MGVGAGVVIKDIKVPTSIFKTYSCYVISEMYNDVSRVKNNAKIVRQILRTAKLSARIYP